MTRKAKEIVKVSCVPLVLFIVAFGFVFSVKAVVESEITGETRIHRKVFNDDHVEFTAEYEEQNGFGVSNWVEMQGNRLQCLQIKLSEDEPKRIIREYPEEKSLKCEQTKIDNWLAQRKSQQLVESEYIKYP